MTSLLVELQTEELPPRALASLIKAFGEGVSRSLASQGLLGAGSETTCLGSPRRLAVRVTCVLDRSPEVEFSKKLMPAAIAYGKDGKASAPLEKKLAAMGLSPETASLATKSEGGKDFVYVEGKTPGIELRAALQKAIAASSKALPIPRVMSYQLADGVTTAEFVRPVRHLTALHGSSVVPVTFLGLGAERVTSGHRFMSKGEIEISSADSYEEELRSAFVMVSPAERRALLVRLLEEKAREAGGKLISNEDLIDEVTALTEWPVVYVSGFEEEFLSVPEECLILTMQLNQKYFPLRGADGRLMNKFLLVSQLVAKDGGREISSGNARVVRARLADAKFFYETDMKTKLESRVPGLKDVVYHAKLGSQLQRMERVRAMAGLIAYGIGAKQPEFAARAALLAKADLRTLMVGEFPELQGIMGQYYALHDGEPEEVALAIREHYQPRFAGDALPSTLNSCALAMADKLETLTGLFGVGQAPTGEKDPYALRRHAISILRIIIEKNLKISLTKLIALAYDVERHVEGVTDERPALRAFFYERLRVMARDWGYSAQETEAVVALEPEYVREVPAILAALRSFEALPEAAALAAANKRISNILRKAGSKPAATVDEKLFEDSAETALYEGVQGCEAVEEKFLSEGRYEDTLKVLAKLKAPVDLFFERVMVNAENPAVRANRLALLARLRGLMNKTALLEKLAK